MQITSDGLKLKNEGRVFHICETQEEVEKALDLLARLQMDLVANPFTPIPKFIEMVHDLPCFRQEKK